MAYQANLTEPTKDNLYLILWVTHTVSILSILEKIDPVLKGSMVPKCHVIITKHLMLQR